MNKKTLILALLFGAMSGVSEGANDKLEKAFMTPPKEAQAWCYWWWLNGAASKEGITRDFEEMQKRESAGRFSLTQARQARM